MSNNNKLKININQNISYLSSQLQNKQTPSHEVHNLDPSIVGLESKVQRHLKENVNPRLIEKWVEDFLKEAEQVGLPSTHMNAQAITPLMRYNLDRASLQKNMMSTELIDRMYRTLFVYSVGFHDIIHELTMHTTNSAEITANIWVVQNILLEQCCRTQFEKKPDGSQDNFEEIHRLKIIRDELTDQKDDLQAKLDQAESELNKEKNLKQSVQNELQTSIQMHEREVNMRLKFESKLNNISGMYKELESRFLVVSKELEVNSTRLNKQFHQLAQNREEIDKLTKQNIELESKNSSITENIKMNEEILQQKNDQIKAIKSELDITKDEKVDLKTNLTLKETEIRGLLTQIKVKEESNTNLCTEQEMRQQKIEMREEFIKHQEMIIEKLSSDILSERKESEDVKNRYTVSIAKVKELTMLNLNLGRQSNSTKEKFNRLEEQNRKLHTDQDTIKFKYTQSIADLMDTMVKLQLTVQVRNETEAWARSLLESRQELQDEKDLFETERKEQNQEVHRLQKVNADFQKEILILNEQKRTQEIMMTNAFQSFKDAQNMSSEMLKREHLNAERFTKQLEEEKDKAFNAISKNMKCEKEKRDLDLKLSRMTIDYSVLKDKQEYISTKYDELKIVQQMEVNKADQSGNRLEWYSETLENQTKSTDQKIIVLKDKYSTQISEIQIEKENLQMNCEDMQMIIKKMGEKIDELFEEVKKKQEKIEDGFRVKNDLLADIEKLKKDNVENGSKNHFLKNENVELASTNSNLDQKIKMLNERINQFKREVKNNLTEIQNLKTPLAALEIMQKQQMEDKKVLDSFINITKNSKELTWHFGGAMKRSNVQTDIDMKAFEKTQNDSIKTDKHKHKTEESHVATGNGNIDSNKKYLNQIREIQKYLSQKKELLQESGHKLQPHEQCPFCSRVAADSKLTTQRDHSTRDNTYREMQSTLATSFDIQKTTVRTEQTNYNINVINTIQTEGNYVSKSHNYHNQGIFKDNLKVKELPPIENKTEMGMKWWEKEKLEKERAYSAIKNKKKSKISNILRFSKNMNYTFQTEM